MVSWFVAIIIIIIISFMQGIYTYIPEKKVPREYIVAAIVLLLFMVPISLVSTLALLCFYVSTFRSMCAVPNIYIYIYIIIIIIIASMPISRCLQFTFFD
jgi:hypothetical protein